MSSPVQFLDWLEPYLDGRMVDLQGPPALKYSPDQPRDERGRWSAGGSGTWKDPRDAHPAAWGDVTREIARQGMGNCYQAAGTLMLNADRLGLRNPTVIHATCTGQGPIKGQAFGHAWLEADGPGHMRMVYDYASGNRVQLPAELYRRMGEARDIHQYDATAARVQMMRTGHYGPWE